jgi:flagellar basal body-associated protein FliL
MLQNSQGKKRKKEFKEKNLMIFIGIIIGVIIFLGILSTIVFYSISIKN